VQVTGAEIADADTLEVCVSGMLDGVEKHLDPRLTGQAWTTTHVWFRPATARVAGTSLTFDFEPSVTWHLRPHAPYLLRLRDAHGLRREERLTWVAIRLPSQAPQGYVPPAAPATKPPPSAPRPDTEDLDETAAERAEAEREAAAMAAAAIDLQKRHDEQDERRREEAQQLRREQEEHDRAELHERQQQPQLGRSKTFVWAGIAAALLAVLAAGAWLYEQRWSVIGTPAPVAQPEVSITLEGARQFLARNPGADESFGMAEKFRTARSLDGEFLLLRNAANKGSAPAALALGEMYDPATYSPETSPLPAPNPEQAVEWYRQAAEAGIAEAQYRLGVLLMSGKTDEPNGPELGVSWLRKAADQGHQRAKDALPK
jgi:TPR repeat protein